MTYVIQHNTDKDIKRNAEEVHDSTPSFLWNILRPHLHNGWPEYSYTCFKNTETDNLDAT